MSDYFPVGRFDKPFKDFDASAFVLGSVDAVNTVTEGKVLTVRPQLADAVFCSYDRWRDGDMRCKSIAISYGLRI